MIVLDVTKDEEITYNLVTSEEADAPAGKISTSSPIGRGLLASKRVIRYAFKFRAECERWKL